MEGLRTCPSFWRGRKVFVTGHTGFKGSWLCLWLGHLGARVTGYALGPPTQPSLFELADVGSRMRSVLGNVQDPETLRAAYAEAQPEIVFHLAAQPILSLSYRQPVETYATNVLGTVHMLETMRQIPCARAAVMITSDKCYSNREWVWPYREDDTLGGCDPYSSSKACAELAIASYRDSFFAEPNGPGEGLALASARAGNVIGGGDWALDRLIPDCMRALMAGETIEIRRPDAVRPWQHVLEPLSGYLLLAEGLWQSPKSFAEAWNFGPRPQSAQPVRYLVDRLVKLWGANASWREAPGQRFHESRHLELDCSKAIARLAWQPRADLDTALRWIVGWFQAVKARQDAATVCIRQIEDFMALGCQGQTSAGEDRR